MKPLSPSHILIPLATCAFLATAGAQTTAPADHSTGGASAKAAKAAGMTPMGTPKTTPGAAPAKITQSAAQQMVNRVLKETSTLRQLSILRPVPSGVKSRDAVEAMVTQTIKEENSSNEIDAADLMLKQLGMAPPNFNLKSFYVKLLGEQVAGYYEPKTKTFYTTPQVNRLELETVMAHELTHALQDQHFDLRKLQAGHDHEGDTQSAIQCLVEGDATLSMSKYATANPLRALGILASPIVSPHNSDLLDSGPRSLKEGLTFPYLQGVVFASNLFKAGGWSKVSQAFKVVPLSTEQILHFEKYTAYERPVNVPLRNVTSRLGKGWTLLDYDVNGEFGSRQILDEYLKDPAESAKAAAGWGGDRIAMYRGPQGAGLVVQDTIWDTESDAREWAQAYSKRTNLRLGLTPQSKGALQVWNSATKGKTNGVWLERRGSRVVILEGKLSSFNPTPVLATLWR